MYTYHSSYGREVASAYFFTAALLAFFIGSIVFAVISTGPIVLGTEMNTNGMVEYLCLGVGCEDLRDMDW